MRKYSLPVAFVAMAFVALLNVAPAQAQATRTWVSGVGDDVNPCSRTAPCKTFPGAISKTAAGGEINCLDPGGFGTVTIIKSITIRCQYTEGGIVAGGVNGVVVNVASTDKVVLEGLDLQGLNQTTNPGLNGIRMIGGGKLYVINSRIEKFGQNGIDIEGTANARVFVQNSIIFGNTLNGILVQGPGGVANSIILDNTTIDVNGGASVRLAAGAALTMSRSVLTGSGLAIDPTGGGTVTSYGDNVVRPPATINTPSPLQ